MKVFVVESTAERGCCSFLKAVFQIIWKCKYRGIPFTGLERDWHEQKNDFYGDDGLDGDFGFFRIHHL